MYMLAIRANHVVDNAICDRGVIGDKVFADVNHQIGNISDDEYSIYLRFYDFLLEKEFTRTTAVIFLDVGVEEILRRIGLRNREIEQSIDAEYVRKLWKCYSTLGVSLQSQLGSRFIMLNWDRPRTDSEIRQTAEDVAANLPTS